MSTFHLLCRDSLTGSHGLLKVRPGKKSLPRRKGSNVSKLKRKIIHINGILGVVRGIICQRHERTSRQNRQVDSVNNAVECKQEVYLGLRRKQAYLPAQRLLAF